MKAILNNIYILSIVINLLIILESVQSFSHYPSFNSKIINKSRINMIDPTVITNTVDDNNKKIDLLYDSECPICAMEVDFLKKRDFENRIKFTDLSSPDYNSSEHGNIKFEDGIIYTYIY